MPYHYSDPEDATDMWSMPNVQTFYTPAADFSTAYRAQDGSWLWEVMREHLSEQADDPTAPTDAEVNDVAASFAGWYWWTCFPGCLPEGSANGPYPTEDAALANARENG